MPLYKIWLPKHRNDIVNGIWRQAISIACSRQNGRWNLGNFSREVRLRCADAVRAALEPLIVDFLIQAHDWEVSALKDALIQSQSMQEDPGVEEFKSPPGPEEIRKQSGISARMPSQPKMVPPVSGNAGASNHSIKAKELGRQLNAKRKGKKLSAKWCAGETEVAISTWRRWESGEIVPSDDHAGAISTILEWPEFTALAGQARPSRPT